MIAILICRANEFCLPQPLTGSFAGLFAGASTPPQAARAGSCNPKSQSLFGTCQPVQAGGAGVRSAVAGGAAVDLARDKFARDDAPGGMAASHNRQGARVACAGGQHVGRVQWSWCSADIGGSKHSCSPARACRATAQREAELDTACDFFASVFWPFCAFLAVKMRYQKYSFPGLRSAARGGAARPRHGPNRGCGTQSSGVDISQNVLILSRPYSRPSTGQQKGHHGRSSMGCGAGHGHCRD